MIVSVSPDAEIELAGGARYYAREANVDLGLAFIAEFERAIAVLSEHPLLGVVWRGTTRRFPLRRFPHDHLPGRVRGSEGDRACPPVSEARVLERSCVMRVSEASCSVNRP